MATLKAVEIKPGTTPLLTAIVDGEDIHEATVYVAIDMGDRRLVKSNYNDEAAVIAEPVYSGSRVVGTQVTVQYSQAESLSLRPGYASVQIGWVFDDLSADKTNIGRLRISRNIIKEVMAYGRHTS